MSGDNIAMTKPAYGPNDKLNTQEAANYCTVSASLLNKLRIKGGGPLFYVVNGKLVRYTPRDLDAWMERDKRLSTSAPIQTRRRKTPARR